jgi:bifunctional NMN adenylyltransferase/nudix hydrolase
VKFGVYIGRFQPFHRGHMRTVQTALEQVDTLILVLGSASGDRTERNPWPTWERANMIESALGAPSRRRYRLAAVKDHPTDDAWRKAVKRAVALSMGREVNPEITLFGSHRDDSTYYLNLFPEWGFVDCKHEDDADVSGTALRAALASGDWLTLKASVHPAVFAMLWDEHKQRGTK